MERRKSESSIVREVADLFVEGFEAGILTEEFLGEMCVGLQKLAGEWSRDDDRKTSVAHARVILHHLMAKRPELWSRLCREHRSEAQE